MTHALNRRKSRLVFFAPASSHKGDNVCVRTLKMVGDAPGEDFVVLPTQPGAAGQADPCLGRVGQRDR